VLAPLLVLHAWWVEGRSPLAAARRALPPIAVTAAWAMVHPLLGGRLWHAVPGAIEAGRSSSPLATLLQVVAVPVNLDRLPRPELGWGEALVPGAVGALILGVLAATGFLSEREPGGGGARDETGMTAEVGRLGGRESRDEVGRSERPRAAAQQAEEERRVPPRSGSPHPPSGPGEGARLAGFGAAWALLGWLPLLTPTLGWHAYYALWGCFGVWLVLGPLLARRPGAALALVVALALVRPARADTPSLDWGSEWYQRRAAEFIRAMRGQLRTQHPRLAPHTRLFFVRVPSNVGFLAGDGPALRVWYDDPTLRAGYYSAYRPRGPAEPQGTDLFFRYDSTSGWVEIVPGDENVPQARRDNPRWIADHETLAATLARSGDWGRAAIEYAKLASADPGRLAYAYDAGVCFESAGDSSAAARWYARAATLPGADPEVREAADRFARHLRAPR
jgi:hypothetical protein